ncbi:hypothetical protein M408DRAFT_331697 [Serendipita vermifera MAFF 305830]|uniref:ubiquitinyl hydrolase 1 n=1 Tax=Serendipita vermifera MAFF 305830 TaxID=933852 RepID=A0A0C2X630_SERVB|nr:hypothetical protein M408DRAFT_331697 [Serendipita vermifera MAFF 305830]
MSDRRTKEQTNEELKFIINHVFLPPKLPQEHDMETHRKDEALLSFVSKTATAFTQGLSVSANENVVKSWGIVLNMLNAMSTLNTRHGISEEWLRKAMEQMDVDDVLPVFIEAQNAAIIFRRVHPDVFTFEAFEVSLPSEVVLNTIGKVSMHFPSNPRLPFPKDTLIFSTLAKVLAHLSINIMQEAMPVSKKGGETHHEVRNTASPMFITEALAGILRATPSKDVVEINTTYVTKRLDDHVLWKSTFKPWRRSSMWLVIKVALQTTLNQWQVIGPHGYKAFQAFIMASILNQAASSDPELFTCDLLVFMNKRLVNRLRKLGDVLENPGSKNLHFSIDIVNSISKVVEERWKEVRELHEKTIQWNLSTILPVSDGCIDVHFPRSHNFLLDLIKRHQYPQKGHKSFDAGAFEAQLRDSLQVLSLLSPAHLPCIAGSEVEFNLRSTEEWIETHLENWLQSSLRSEKDCLPLTSMINAYMKVASNRYKDDPERVSLMHLCVMELWVALDKICTKWCPLLEQYSPEIAQNFADPLLLPYRGQMIRARRVHAHLRSRHQRAIEHGNMSVFKNVDTETSFHNRYFNCPSADPLLLLEAKMQAAAVNEKIQKISELEKSNTTYKQLMQKAHEEACVPNIIEVNKEGRPYPAHPWYNCGKCKLRNRANNLRITPWEDFLPEETVKARPIVFELECPLPFATWRETTVNIILSFLGEDIKPRSDVYLLCDYHPLKTYFRAPYHGYRLNFASSVKSLAQAHYGDDRRFPADEKDVLFKHKGIFNMYDRMADESTLPFSSFKGSLRTTCTFQVGGIYGELQHFINDTRHSPNSVLASLSKTPHGMNPTEFRTFGMIRAGNRLQWRNIMASLRSQTLSFSEPAILALILQSIWQAGPVGPNIHAEDFYREAHMDLADENFGIQVAGQLLRIIRSLDRNWKQTNYMSILVSLTLRLYAFTPHLTVKVQAQNALKEARSLLEVWIGMIETSFSPRQSSGLTSDDFKDHKAQTLANSAVVLQATFDARCEHRSSPFKSTEDATIYIYATILSSAVHTRSFDPGLRLLASRHSRVSLSNEIFLVKACLEDPAILQKVVRLAWPKHAHKTAWRPLPSCGTLWWKSSYLSETFYMNIATGVFLINGKAFDRLPGEYGTNSDYISLFQDHVFHSVSPSNLPGMHYMSDYSGYEVHFGIFGENMTVLRVDENDVQEYIPLEKLAQDLPAILSNQYCFWYSKNNRGIETRPASSKWAKDDARKWVIPLQNYTYHSTARVQSTIPSGNQKSGNQNLVDPHSAIHAAFEKTLSSLEPDKRGFLVTMHNGDKQEIFIHVARHNLRFRLVANQLECTSLPGYIVDTNLAGIGCLTGLKSLLNLRHSDSRQNRRKIIIPKGTLITSSGRYGHVHVSIDIGDSSGYFVYDVDELVGRLVGTRTIESDLYIIKMHAFTASALPDSLTQRSGTTEALDRLASAGLVSGSMLSQEARSNLGEILALTPLRTFYPTHLRVMETVSWSNFLPASTQHPGFRSLVQKILSFWRETEDFTNIGDLAKEPESVDGIEQLTHRAALRNCDHSSFFGFTDWRDIKYNARNSLADPLSREREMTVFKAANLIGKPASGLPICKNLREVVHRWNEIQGVKKWGWNNIEIWLSSPRAAAIQDVWCSFYELCRLQKSPRFDVVVALAFQSFRGAPLDIIASLSAVINDHHQFSDFSLACPKFTNLALADGHVFDRSSILIEIQKYKLPFEQSDEYRAAEESEYDHMLHTHTAYNQALQKECEDVLDELENNWSTLPEYIRTKLRLLQITPPIFKSNIRPILKSWVQNEEFLSNIDRIQEFTSTLWVALSCEEYAPIRPTLRLKSTRDNYFTLESLMRERRLESLCDLQVSQGSVSPLQVSAAQETVNTFPSLLARLRDAASNDFQQSYVDDLQRSSEAYGAELSHIQDGLLHGLDEASLIVLRSALLGHSQACLHQFRQWLRPTDIAGRMMQLAGTWPIATTFTLLRCLSLKIRRLLPTWVAPLTAHAVAVHDARRATRMLEFAQANMDVKHLLQNEMKYSRTWAPSEHPDWLLIEIDANMSIRPTQADMAKRMLCPLGGKNTVMQLNMGEGKSSVIVPIAAASASTGDCLCRVIILGPQIKQQVQILRQTLTGICNRPIIYLPFNRKLDLEPPAITKVQKILQKAMNEGAIWICEPEHLLSLKLLGLDRAIKFNCRELIGIQNWLHQNSRDILDESDEILHVRQQVIYTVGAQLPLDGAPVRWEIVQGVLNRLSTYLTQKNTCEDFSSFLVENREQPAAFPVVRITSNAARQQLHEFVKDSIQQNDWSIPPYMHDLAIDFVTNLKVSTDTTELIQQYCSRDNEVVMQKLLTLRGLIAYDVLLHTLKEKRWRVHYGLDLRRKKLAIPFRAKDSPSPRSEFGHPDVTIILTCLSYYYRGLDMEMMTHTLQALLLAEAGEDTYRNWLKGFWKDVPEALKTIKGIDLYDEELINTRIFPLLRYNAATINFYLNTFVFPVYAKEFPSKISTSGWDLAIAKPAPTTGFSGTNDGSYLLPANITQCDQPAQVHTNAKVLSYILREENSNVVRYANFARAEDILSCVNTELSPPPTVILDVGAQILDLSNVVFVKIWLKMYPDDPVIKAAVCFDDADNLLVVTPDGVTQSFVESPYSSQLDHCLIYLDESHTRGTDLRIPTERQAVVTLGPKLNKDKLVQGCMRMRQLGHGHSLVFAASEEIYGHIRATINSDEEEITSEDVIFWSIKETWRQMQENLPAWEVQGRSFVTRDASWVSLNKGNLPKAEDISRKFCESERKTLKTMYGPGTNQQDPQISTREQGGLQNRLTQEIIQKCEYFHPIHLISTGVNEEMEIEFVHEKEVERVIERPPDAQPATHRLHPNVQMFVATGDVSLCRGKGFRNATAAFENTSLIVPADLNRVLSNIVVTKDFFRTIQIPPTDSFGCMNSFMRSVDWVVTAVNAQNSLLMVLFSPYEVNQLLPRFRTSTKVKLHSFAPRNNLGAISWEDFNFLTLPSTTTTFSLPRTLALQLNLFSGSVYLRDYETYRDVCRVLRLHFGPLDHDLRKPEIINASFFVLDPQARQELEMGEFGFNVNALPFFQNMIRLRRFGREFGPSHMGKILYGTRLRESDFVEEAPVMEMNEDAPIEG